MAGLVPVIALCVLGSSTCAAEAGGTRRVRAEVIDYRSDHFVVHTDLSSSEALAVANRMETALKYAVKHWRRPLLGSIECYIVRDLKNWSSLALPHPLGRIFIGGIGGATIARRSDSDSNDGYKAVVYAVNEPGVAEHEVVHAYCIQTFGTSGPDWYKEGMAETALHDRGDETGVQCPPYFMRVLREGVPRTCAEVVQGGPFTDKITESLVAMKFKFEDGDGRVPLSAWTEEDSDTVKAARKSYVWSWALCQMLSRNRNYANRFQTLGHSYLAHKTDRFDELFSPMRRQIRFEYAFFLRHVDIGYCVDLCRWDWHKPFTLLDNQSTVTARIVAKRGYQSSGLNVTKNTRYAYSTFGTWTTESGQLGIGAEGQPDGQGRLVGVIMKHYRLQDEFQLGRNGTFKAPHNGNLFLRCQDDWNKLSDNGGSILVRFASTPNRE